MTWSPNPAVRIGGVDYTSNVYGEITFFRGRRTVYERTNAGYATIQIQEVGGDIGVGPPTSEFRVGQDVEIDLNVPVWSWSGMASTWSAVGSTWSTVVTATYSQEPAFYGTLSDWFATVTPIGGVPRVGYTLQVIGPLARLNRTQIFSAGRVEELDGARVLAAVGSAVPSQDASLIDPGTLAIAALGSADGGYNALLVSQDAGYSAEGVIYETADGQIAYADADRRRANDAAGYLEIPFSSLSAGGVGFYQTLADLTNRVVIDYDGGAVTDEDQFSIDEYGLYETRIGTQIANGTAAAARADEFISRHSRPQIVFEQVRFNLAGIDDVLRGELAALNVNDAVAITGVPSEIGFLRFEGFVEGVGYNVDQFNIDLTLTISDSALSIPSESWGQIGTAVRWIDVEPTQTWAEARQVEIG